MSYYPPFRAYTISGTITWDGKGATFGQGSLLQDGIYNRIVVKGGRIAGLEYVKSNGYTPSATAPLPGEKAVPQDIPISGMADNLTTYRPNDGIYTHASFADTEAIPGDPQSATVTWTGNGRSENPWKATVTVASVSDLNINVETPLTKRIDPATKAVILGMADSPLAGGQYNAFTTDSYGRVIAFDATYKPPLDIINPSGPITLVINDASNNLHTLIIDKYGRVQVANA